MKSKRTRRGGGSRKSELADLMRFIEFTNLFKKVERLIWYKGVDRQECDGEHAFQLAIVCWFVNERCARGLSTQLLIEYALVHDLVETYAGDTPAFVRNGNGAETPCRINKAEREQLAKERIIREWSVTFPTLIERMDAYDKQGDEESRFVYAMDKFLAELNIAEDEGRSNRRLGVTIETSDLYKRPRIERHPFILELYEEHFKVVLANRERFFATPASPP